MRYKQEKSLEPVRSINKEGAWHHQRAGETCQRLAPRKEDLSLAVAPLEGAAWGDKLMELVSAERVLGPKHPVGPSCPLSQLLLTMTQ